MASFRHRGQHRGQHRASTSGRRGTAACSQVPAWRYRSPMLLDALYAEHASGQANLNCASVRLPPDHEVLACATPDELLCSCSDKVGLLWVRLEVERTRTAVALR